MSPLVKKAFLLMVLFGTSGVLASSLLNPNPVSGANETAGDALSLEARITGKDDGFKPVDNIHHFMEYIYEPVIHELKEAVAKEPADKAGWNSIKSNSLILAETSILLAERKKAEDDSPVWHQSSKLVYDGGSAMYQAARKKDFDVVKKGFGQLVNGCKQCHEKYRK